MGLQAYGYGAPQRRIPSLALGTRSYESPSLAVIFPKSPSLQEPVWVDGQIVQHNTKDCIRSAQAVRASTTLPHDQNSLSISDTICCVKPRHYGGLNRCRLTAEGQRASFYDWTPRFRVAVVRGIGKWSWSLSEC